VQGPSPPDSFGRSPPRPCSARARFLRRRDVPAVACGSVVVQSLLVLRRKGIMAEGRLDGRL
jgi:hypothetical protein